MQYPICFLNPIHLKEISHKLVYPRLLKEILDGRKLKENQRLAMWNENKPLLSGYFFRGLICLLTSKAVRLKAFLITLIILFQMQEIK
jgi:hypothetical protein